MSPVDLLVAYGLANILAVIPITPGGLGVVEGVLIPTLVGLRRAAGRSPRSGVLGLAPHQLLAAHPRRGRLLPVAARRAPAGPATRATAGVRRRSPPAGRSPTGRSLGALDVGSAAARRSRRRRARSMASSLSRPATLTPVHVRDAAPAPVRPEHPGVGVVGEDQVENLEQAGLQLGVVHRHQHLDAPVEVALHQVGRADEELERQRPAAPPAPCGHVVRSHAAEAVDAGVLEETARRSSAP